MKYSSSHCLCLALAILAGGTAVSLAADEELPARRPGYWEIRMIMDGNSQMPEMNAHLCIDAATDKTMMAAGLNMTKSLCSKKEFKHDGDRYIWDAECTIGGMKSRSQTVISGDFQASYEVKITGDSEGGPGGAAKTNMTQRAKWLSEACPADFKPGDMEMPGGIKVNAVEMMKLMSPD